MPRRVVVTGLGVISALGATSGEFWQALEAGRSGIAPIEAVDRALLRFSNGAEVRNYSPARHFDEKEIGLLDRFAQFGAIAAREAIAQAGIEWTQQLRESTAIVTGSCTGGQTTEDEGFVSLYRNNNPRVNPFTIPRTMENAAASRISLETGVVGPTYTISTACSSSNHAIGQAFWMVRSGVVDMAITGGSEAVFSLGFLKAWEAMRVISPDTCRPFSKDRRGLILGEGAAMLVLEPLETARARGATILGEISGFGMSSDAFHITQPSPDGAARAMRAALTDAGIRPAEIEYINAHGTATLANDATETTAIRKVFGPHADRIAVSSTKSMHGHTLGAAGAIEAAATVLALHHATLPPTANFTEPDPACDLDVIPNVARLASPEFALSNSFAFGGLNAVLAFRRVET
ncbi:MAG TPA: beta-ketoacyl-[acyl-carrier-protein] synthase family protein [Bryobacteraceae bacterium]|jgi:nodulation protein E|nr:beta-ketoacyl-[acyl-carrier-protein] synthase family protein [Bryobacteraceae bacterium]